MESLQSLFIEENDKFFKKINDRFVADRIENEQQKMIDYIARLNIMGSVF